MWIYLSQIPSRGGGQRDGLQALVAAPFSIRPKSVGQSGPKVYLRLFGVSAAQWRLTNHLLGIVCIVKETGL